MHDIYILFDCPDERNDKKWLIEELGKAHKGRVCSVPIKRVLSVVSRKGLFGQLYAKWIPVWQNIRALTKSKKDDAIICWQSYTGNICAFLCRLLRKNRKLICMNWLTPERSDRRWASIRKWILQNPRCRVTVNSPETPGEWSEFLEIGAIENFILIPDVYDTTVLWKQPSIKEEKYFFAGGMNNRNWTLLSEVARECENVKFICVALEADFKSQVPEVPPNMAVYFNIPAKEYYSYMSGAYAVLLPLRDGRVAGLINIIRAAQAGVACCVSKTVATEQYYPMQNRDMLLDATKEEWVGCIQSLLAMDDKRYLEKIKANQEYIQKTFSGEAAADKILTAINQM